MDDSLTVAGVGGCARRVVGDDKSRVQPADIYIAPCIAGKVPRILKSRSVAWSRERYPAVPSTRLRRPSSERLQPAGEGIAGDLRYAGSRGTPREIGCIRRDPADVVTPRIPGERAVCRDRDIVIRRNARPEIGAAEAYPADSVAPSPSRNRASGLRESGVWRECVCACCEQNEKRHYRTDDDTGMRLFHSE